jgi:hypothetical protein
MRKLVFLITVIFLTSISEGAVFQFQRALTALYTTFDNSTNGFVSTNVQAAIEEVKNIATDKPTYPIQASYNGNANIGRYLEAFPGEDTLTSTILLPDACVLHDFVIQAESANNGAITIKNITTNTVIYNASFAGQKRQIFLNQNLGIINGGDELTVYVTAASINKPKIRMWFKTI